MTDADDYDGQTNNQYCNKSKNIGKKELISKRKQDKNIGKE